MKQYKVIRKLEIDNLEAIFNIYAEDEYRALSVFEIMMNLTFEQY